MNASPVTKVKNSIQKSIALGILREGDRLESVRDLCRTYNTCKDSICKALAELAKMGLIELEARKAPRIRPWKEKKIALLYASKTEVFYDIFWNEYAQGILAAFEEHPEYKVEIFNIATAGSAAIAEAIEKENYCGIISLGYQYFDRDNFRHLNEFGLPMVFTGPDPMEGTVNFCPEFSAALNEIAERLQFPELPVPLYCLHTRSGLKNVTYSEKFYQTGKMLQKHFGISISKDDIAQRENDDDLAFLAQITEKLRRRKRPNIAILDSDSIGPVFFRALHDTGLRCPEDIAVFSFDNLPAAQFTIPALTTIDLKRAETGRLAAQHLLDCLDGKPAISTQYSAAVIFRESFPLKTTHHKKYKTNNGETK